MRSLLAALALAALVQGNDVSLEYRVKAAYLFNFTRFVDWPPEQTGAVPLRICTAESNPFGPALQETLAGEQVNGRPLQAAVVKSAAGCHVLFVPRGVDPGRYLREAKGRAVLTVGETPGFVRLGGMVNFVLDDGKVRFEMDPQAAERSDLKVSSRLMRLARFVPPDEDPEWAR